MQIARLKGDASVADLARRVYGLAKNAPQLAAATAALQTANPHMATGIGTLPSGTPVVVPSISGLSTAACATTPDPRIAVLLGALQAAAQQAAAQLAAGPTTAAQNLLNSVPTPPKPAGQITASDLRVLTTNISTLAKQFGG